MPTYVSPYTVTVISLAGGLAHCRYVDGNNQPVPSNTPLTTQTPKGQEGSLIINFTETTVDTANLRLVGAAVKTIGNDPTMNPYNYLPGTRAPADDQWIDEVIVPWGPDLYTTRGVVLLFAQVTDSGDMVNFFPSSDPQTQNNDTDSAC